MQILRIFKHLNSLSDFANAIMVRFSMEMSNKKKDCKNSVFELFLRWRKPNHRGNSTFKAVFNNSLSNKKLLELSEDRTFCIEIFEAMTQTSCDLLRNIEDFM